MRIGKQAKKKKTMKRATDIEHFSANESYF